MKKELKKKEEEEEGKERKRIEINNINARQDNTKVCL